MGFVFRIEPKPGYLFVWQQGCPSVSDLIQMQDALEQSAKLHGVGRVLFDNRELVHPGEQVRDFMINWMDRNTVLRVQALVMHSDLIAVRTSMDGLAKRVSRRGFRTIGEAEVWLAKKTTR
jgi:hypothetical protein